MLLWHWCSHDYPGGCGSDHGRQGSSHSHQSCGSLNRDCGRSWNGVECMPFWNINKNAHTVSFFQVSVHSTCLNLDFISNVWDSIHIKFDDKFWQSLVRKFEINFEKLEIWKFFSQRKCFSTLLACFYHDLAYCMF